MGLQPSKIQFFKQKLSRNLFASLCYRPHVYSKSPNPLQILEEVYVCAPEKFSFLLQIYLNMFLFPSGSAFLMKEFNRTTYWNSDNQSTNAGPQRKLVLSFIN